MATTLGCAREFAQVRPCLFRGLRGIMRMHANGGINERIPIGQADGGFQIRRAVAGADGHHALHARRAGAFDGLVAIGVEFGIVQVDVGIAPTSLQPRPDRNVFQEARQHRLAAVHRSGHDHAVRFDAFQFARLQIGDDHHFAADQVCSGVYASAMPATMVRGCPSPISTFICISLSGILDWLRGQYLAHAQIHFQEIVDSDFRRPFRGGRGFGFLTHQHLLRRGDFGFQFPHPVDRWFELNTRENAGYFADFLPSRQPAPRQRSEPEGFDGLRHAELLPRSCGAFRGSTG